jgi:hypothetical protein
MLFYTVHTARATESKQSFCFPPLHYTSNLNLNKRVTQSRQPVGGRVEEWLVMVDFDTIRLSLTFQANRLCLTKIIIMT